ncbi:unnamed protein product [Orchesella dallaii]|uniref:Arrestin C-terminal-like domain-containing protein n=1 Tax=Orchesella dallaii TaxID=48710 RepID=A0ABP1QYS3_9HEXA
MTHYSDEEAYIQEKVYLFGYDDNSDGNTYTLPTGKHIYPFSFVLPESLPSSLTHKHGQVKYYLEATISRGQGITKPNYTCRLQFSVNAILDLNNEFGAQHEGMVSKEKNVCCFCCKSGPVGFDFKIFKSGFVPGEVVKFHADLFNHSTREVSTVVDLVQDMKFHAMGRSKSKSVQIITLEGPKLKPSETKEWKSDFDTTAMLRIPSVPPSRLDGCRIIEVTYYLKVKMDVKDAVTLKEYVPITIGTIPLREDFAELGGGELGDSQVEVTMESDLTTVILLPNYPDLPPPTYEEAITLSYSEPLEDDDLPPEYMSVVKFIPKYATYSPRSAHVQQK